MATTVEVQVKGGNGGGFQVAPKADRRATDQGVATLGSDRLMVREKLPSVFDRDSHLGKTVCHE